MEYLDKIVKLVENEFKAITENGRFRSREEIDSVYKLVDIVKDVHCIWSYEDDESEYSEDGRSYDESYRGGNSMARNGRSNDGTSYARGRGRNARRYANGRYAPTSRDSSYRGNSYRGYSMDEKHDFIANLHDMMEDAPDDQTRQSLQRMIQQLEQ